MRIPMLLVLLIIVLCAMAVGAPPPPPLIVPWVLAANTISLCCGGPFNGAAHCPFETEVLCRNACTAQPHCTMYGCDNFTAPSVIEWHHRCYGRNDNVWMPQAVPNACSPLTRRRIVPAPTPGPPAPAAPSALSLRILPERPMEPALWCMEEWGLILNLTYNDTAGMALTTALHPGVLRYLGMDVITGTGSNIWDPRTCKYLTLPAGHSMGHSKSYPLINDFSDGTFSAERFVGGLGVLCWVACARQSTPHAKLASCGGYTHSNGMRSPAWNVGLRMYVHLFDGVLHHNYSPNTQEAWSTDPFQASSHSKRDSLKVSLLPSPFVCGWRQGRTSATRCRALPCPMERQPCRRHPTKRRSRLGRSRRQTARITAHEQAAVTALKVDDNTRTSLTVLKTDDNDSRQARDSTLWPNMGSQRSSSPPPVCNTSSSRVNVMSTFGAIGDGVTDDHAAIQSAIVAASHHPCGGGQVWFPPAVAYLVSQPLIIMSGEGGVARGGLALIGGGGAEHNRPPQFAYSPQTTIITNAPTGPALQVGNLTQGVGINDVDLLIQDMSFVGVETGLVITGSAGIRMINIGAAALNWTGGRDNAGAIISNTYWLSCTQCAFETVSPPDAYCRHFPPNPNPGGWSEPPLCYGTKPSLILRGEHPGGKYAGVHDCYLLRFESIIFKKGGVQYQQLYSAPHGVGEKIGYFEFRSVVMEESWTPLLDIVVDPALEASQNYSLITIDHFMSADASPKNSSFEWTRPPLVRFNCTQLYCTLGGVSISGVGMVDQAVQVVNGQLGGFGGGVTVLSSESTVKVAVDADGRSLGGTVGRSAAGLAVVGPAVASDSASVELGSSITAALAVSAAGDIAARLAVSAMGHISWSDGGVPGQKASPTATLGTIRTSLVSWDPPPLEANGVANLNVTVSHSEPGDVATASLASLGFADAQVTANVAENGTVKVILRNVGATPVDVAAGALRVVVAPYRSALKTDDIGTSCSLNGEPLLTGQGSVACTCDRGWAGHNCSQLNEAISKVIWPAPGRPRNQSAGAWGGSLLQSQDKIWHLFDDTVCQNHETIHTSGGQIVHATASSPLGPFVLQGVAVPPELENVHAVFDPFHHMAHLFFVQHTKYNPNISSCTGSSQLPKVFQKQLDPMLDVCSAQGVRMAVASSSTSTFEFSSREYPALLLRPGEDNTTAGTTNYAQCGMNPSAWIDSETGETFLATRKNDRLGGFGEQLALWRAESARGPFVLAANFSWPGEDPHLYRTHRGWHLMYHRFNHHNTVTVGHAWAAHFEGPWEHESAAGKTIQFGSDEGPFANRTISFSRRERPEMVLDDRGVPKYIVSSVEWLNATGGSPHDYTIITSLKSDDNTRTSRVRKTLLPGQPNIVLIGVGKWHNRSSGPPTPYEFETRSAAAAGCGATADYSRLCNKKELIGFSNCANGWCADWEGYWIDHFQTGCGHKGFNPASSSLPPSTAIGGAYCCLPLPSNSTHIQHISSTRFATAGGAKSKPAVVMFNSPAASADGAVSCRVSSVNGGYNLDWSSARRAKPFKNSTSTPGDFHMFPTAVRINATAVACSMPTVLVAGPGELAISVDGNRTWSVGAPIMFFDAVSAAIARRPYFAEAAGHLILQSDPTLHGATLDVTVLLTYSNKTWSFPRLPGGAKAKLLALPFAGLPHALNNDLVVTVAVRGGTDLPWKSVEAGAIATTIVMYTRLIRAAPPLPSSAAVPVQIDREHVGSLLVGGKRFTGIGWYVSLNGPTCVSGATPRNTCDEGIPNITSMASHLATLSKQGVNMVMIYGLLLYNASSQKWLLDQAVNSGVKLLLEFPEPPGYKSATQACGEWQNDTEYQKRIESTVAVAINHAATLGYFICDDCVTQGETWADNYRCIAVQAQLYNLARTVDPYHIYAGAITGTMGWWFSDTGQGFLPPTPNVLSQQTLQLGSQPTTQLSVDFFLQEK